MNNFIIKIPDSLKKIRIKLFSHNDLDGYGANVLLSLIPEATISEENHTYGSIAESIENFVDNNVFYYFDLIFIVDLAIGEANIIDKINSLPEDIRKKFIWLDHHDTSTRLEPMDWAYLVKDLNGRLTCGTELLWTYLVTLCRENNKFNKGLNNLTKESTIEFVESVRLYDTWDWSRVSEDITLKYQPVENNMLFYSIGYSSYMSRMKIKLLNNASFTWDELESFIILNEEKNKNLYLEKKMKDLKVKSFMGYTAGYVFAEAHISNLGYYIMTNNKENIDLVIIINAPNKVSLRTNKDNVDLVPIAKSLGGGGSQKTAGFSCSEEFIVQLLKD